MKGVRINEVLVVEPVRNGATGELCYVNMCVGDEKYPLWPVEIRQMIAALDALILLAGLGQVTDEVVLGYSDRVDTGEPFAWIRVMDDVIGLGRDEIATLREVLERALRVTA